MIVMKDEMFILGCLFKLFNRMTIKKLLYKPKQGKQNTTDSHNKENLRFTSSTPVFSKRNVLNQSRTAKIHKDPGNPQLDQSPCGQHCAASCSFWTAHRHPAGLFCTSFAFECTAVLLYTKVRASQKQKGWVIAPLAWYDMVTWCLCLLVDAGGGSAGD